MTKNEGRIKIFWQI